MTAEQRFWSKVAQVGNVCECWIWTAYKSINGYGKVRFKGEASYAHRVSVELFGREIPPGMQIDHLCRERACVNPWHLEVVTSQENTLRGTGPSAKAAIVTHCPKGHEYIPGNTYQYSGRGGRQCKACTKIKNHARKAAK